MKMNVELEYTTKTGKIHITAEIDNQPDLYEFNRLYKDYYPRKKILGLI